MTINVLGTSHISPEAAAKVDRAVSSGAYDIVALELDPQRLQALFDADKRQASFFSLARAVGVSGALFAKLGHWVEHKLGGRIGMEPGEEMRAAVRAAAEHDVKVALIDRPLNVTLKRFTRAFTLKEKLRLFLHAFRLTRIKFDLRKVPDDALVQRMIAELERASPALARVLVHERNEYMAQRLRALQDQHPDADILAVVGAGHVPGMTERLNTLSDDNGA